MQMRDFTKLYAGLTPPERARLVAQCIRTHDFDTLSSVRNTVPDSQARVFNHQMAIARQMTSYLPARIGLLDMAVLGDYAKLRFASYAMATSKLDWIALGYLWELIGYPVTQSEYDRLVAMERDDMEPLEALATHIYEACNAQEAEDAGWRPEIVRWLATSEAETDAAAEAETLALVHAAIARGELPKAQQTPEGPSLPHGILRDWLHPGRAYEPMGPGFCVPGIEALAGDMGARWDIHPDSDQATVTARRDRIARALRIVAGPARPELPSIHPPADKAEQDRQQKLAEAQWGWADKTIHEHMTAIGESHAQVRAEWQALGMVMDELRDEDFAGESPILEELDIFVDSLNERMAAFADLWREVGEGLYLFEENRLPLPELPEAGRVKIEADTREVLRACN
jgi:hypothetical protein